MKDIDVKKVCEILNEVMECELAGVVRYTHSSMMVSGPHRIPIVDFLKEQANESLLHAQQAGEILTGLDGHPTQNIAEIKEDNEMLNKTQKVIERLNSFAKVSFRANHNHTF